MLLTIVGIALLLLAFITVLYLHHAADEYNELYRLGKRTRRH